MLSLYFVLIDSADCFSILAFFTIARQIVWQLCTKVNIGGEKFKKSKQNYKNKRLKNGVKNLKPSFSFEIRKWLRFQQP